MTVFYKIFEWKYVLIFDRSDQKREMKENEIIRIQNEIYTKIVIEELQKQKVAGKAIIDYVLDKYEIDNMTKERLKKFLSE
jgi:hypothetical protein